jgi:hypothetical protein
MGRLDNMIRGMHKPGDAGHDTATSTLAQPLYVDSGCGDNCFDCTCSCHDRHMASISLSQDRMFSRTPLVCIYSVWEARTTAHEAVQKLAITDGEIRP